MTLVTHKKASRERKADPAGTKAGAIEDANLQAAALLYDMASLQGTERSRFGYKRAAKAISRLRVPVADLVRAGKLREVPYVGPASERIISEYVTLGRSPTVEAALEKAGPSADAAAKRALRDGYLSHAILAQALEAEAEPGVVSKAEYRGDFQMHSTWSDGGERIVSMAAGAMELGHTCLGITDHSHGLPIANGISMEQAGKQWEEIDKLNVRYAGNFRIFKGIEANILTDGALDVTLDDRRRFEFVVASPHSQLRRKEDQTPRMIAAVKAPAVAILGHPRGRMFNTRPGITADWDAVFEAAARHEVAIELDGNWHRQDIDYLLARRALDAGCLFALDSDAHSIEELRFSDYAIAHARIAGIPTARVINCWTDQELEDWMQRRRKGAVVGRRRRGM